MIVNCNYYARLEPAGRIFYNALNVKTRGCERKLLGAKSSYLVGLQQGNVLEITGDYHGPLAGELQYQQRCRLLPHSEHNGMAWAYTLVPSLIALVLLCFPLRKQDR